MHARWARKIEATKNPAKKAGFFELVKGFVISGFPPSRTGNVLLSRDLSQSTIDAEGFYDRVRNGIG
jgi:hypothetical protein